MPHGVPHDTRKMYYFETRKMTVVAVRQYLAKCFYKLAGACKGKAFIITSQAGYTDIIFLLEMPTTFEGLCVVRQPLGVSLLAQVHQQVLANLGLLM